jgi:hypothetical protein
MCQRTSSVLCYAPRTAPCSSTYDMLCFAIKYRKAIDEIASECKNNLRQFEMLEEEWAIAEELRDILKVCHWMS